MRIPLFSLLTASVLAAAPALAQTTEDFETYPIGVGSATNLGVLTLDENTIANGYGPNLVKDGCVYSCAAGSLQWDGAGYFGAPSKNLLANSGDGLLTLTYDTAVSSVQLELLTFAGYPDNTTVTVYNSSNTVIHTATLSVPGASPVPFSHSAANIKKVTIKSNTWPWSTLIDNHVFGNGGPTLSKSGSCPGATTVTVTGATPGGPVALAMSASTGSFVIPGGGCAGTVLGLASPALVAVLGANGAGTASISGNLPAGLCGRWLQAVDLNSCGTTNTLQL